MKFHFNGWRPETPEMNATLPQERHFAVLAKNPTFAAQVAPSTTGVVDLRPQCPPVYNQYQLGSCVANAIVGDLEFLELQQGMPYVHLSRLFVYYNARLEQNETDVDNGSVISLAMLTLTKMGVCADPSWPYDQGNVFVRPSWDAYRDAFGHTIVQSYKITSSGDDRHGDIQSALNARHPVVFGTYVYEPFQGVGPDGNVPMPKGSDKLLGGHAMLIVGYDLNRQVYIVRNSWDVSWGDQGYCYMPFAYLDAAKASDFWVGTKIG